MTAPPGQRQARDNPKRRVEPTTPSLTQQNPSIKNPLSQVVAAPPKAATAAAAEATATAAEAA